MPDTRQHLFLLAPDAFDGGGDLGFGATLRGFSEGQRVFERYRLERVLGRGGMGVVWLGYDEELERRVALKFLPELVCLDREAISDLKRETRRSLDITHPNIVRIYDFHQDEQTAAISMEHVDGPTLSARKVEAGGCLGVGELRPILRQLCEALDYAHQRARVVHRDLKPANLMLTADGELKVTDFGIACSISDSVSRVSMARGASGTAVFMSPQQALGERPTAADDIYALGATIYDLLAGKPPFYRGDVLTQLREADAAAMSERRAELGLKGEPIPEGWEAVVRACLSKEPAGRPGSAGEVYGRLDSGPESRRPAPGAPGTGGAGRRGTGDKSCGVRPSSSVAWAGMAAVALVIAGGGWWVVGSKARVAEAERLAAEANRVSGAVVQPAAEPVVPPVAGGPDSAGVGSAPKAAPAESPAAAPVTPPVSMPEAAPVEQVIVAPAPPAPVVAPPRSEAPLVSEPDLMGRPSFRATGLFGDKPVRLRQAPTYESATVGEISGSAAFNVYPGAGAYWFARGPGGDDRGYVAASEIRILAPDWASASYVARFGRADFVNSRGLTLTELRDILRQDRANFYNAPGSDIEDTNDGIFGDKATREWFEGAEVSLINPGGGNIIGALVRVDASPRRIVVTVLPE